MMVHIQQQWSRDLAWANLHTTCYRLEQVMSAVNKPRGFTGWKLHCNNGESAREVVSLAGGIFLPSISLQNWHLKTSFMLMGANCFALFENIAWIGTGETLLSIIWIIKRKNKDHIWVKKTSVEAERSFSLYKHLLDDRRMSMSEEVQNNFWRCISTVMLRDD